MAERRPAEVIQIEELRAQRTREMKTARQRRWRAARARHHKDHTEKGDTP